MISIIISAALSILSAFGIVPDAQGLASSEQSMKSPVQRIASLQSFSLELAPGGWDVTPHLPFNEDSGGFPQTGGDLPILPPLKPKDILEPLTLDASAALAVDTGTKSLLYQLNSEEPKVLASLTKLATALVIVDQNPDWNALVEIVPSDLVGGESVKFSTGDRVSMRDLFFATLVGSANNAVVALVRGSGLSEIDAVGLMNEKARSFGLEHTAFVDVTGLKPGNVSTPREFAVIVSHAFADQRIFEAVSTKQYVVETASGSRRTVQTTNWLLRDDKVTAGKTGYIDEAGYNLVALSRYGSRTILTLVFGTSSNDARFSETEKLLEWVKENYEE